MHARHLPWLTPLVSLLSALGSQALFDVVVVMMVVAVVVMVDLG